MSEKTCANCRHRDVPADEHPCRWCFAVHGSPRWEPREEPHPERTEPWDAWKPGRDVR